MRKRKSKAAVNASRWAAYASAGLATSFCIPVDLEADTYLVEPNVELRDPNIGNGKADTVYEIRFSSAPHAYLEFIHAYSETGVAEGVLFLTPRNFSSAAYMSVAGAVTGGYYSYGSNVASGQNVSGLQYWGRGYRGGVVLAWGGGYTNSQFLNTGGYVAFRFDVGNGTQYGWAELQLDQGAPQNIFTLTRFAWADPGEQIRVGRVPEPGSLSVLAMGAAGLLCWRRKREPADRSKDGGRQTT